MAVATTAWTHSGHPHVTGSRILDKEATGSFFSPYSWVTTPKADPLSTFREGRASRGGDQRVFKFLYHYNFFWYPN
jgi:hypothetical protein